MIVESKKSCNFAELMTKNDYQEIIGFRICIYPQGGNV